MSPEWPLKKLGKICKKIGSGSTPRGGKEAYLSNGEFSLIRSQNIYNDGFSPGGLAFISSAQAKKLDGVSVEVGDVLINITGDSVARVCRAPAEYLPARVNQHVAIIRPDPKILNTRYLHYFLVSPNQQKYLLGLAAAGATRNALTKGMIEDLSVPCPPLQYQKAIADSLGALDDRITLLRKTNKTLESIAQAIFKSWFVDFDPVRAKMEGRQPEGMDEETAALFPDSFEESELGLIPRGWAVGCLGEVATTARNLVPVDSLNDSQIYIGLEHLPRKSLSLNDWGLASGLESTKTAFSSDDILFGKLRPYFHKVVIAPFEGVCSTDILACQPKQAAFYGFVALHLFSDELVTYADRLSNGAKMPRINWKDLAAYPMTIPPAATTLALDVIIRPMFNEIKHNSSHANTLASLRDTLLPRLISGQLRLPEAENLVQEACA